jgi:hypothetical protein
VVRAISGVSHRLSSREYYLMLLDNVLAKTSKQAASAGDRVIELRPSLVFDAKNTILSNLGQLSKTLNREPRPSSAVHPQGDR